MNIVKLSFAVFVLQPIVEYWVHRAVHRFRLQEHLEHHANFSLGHYWRFRAETIVCIAMALSVVSQNFIMFCMILRHAIGHAIVHRTPSLRFLHRHHFLHHRDPSCNFCFTALWPDRLFGTLSI